MPDEPTTSVLLMLRLKAFAPEAAIATELDLDPPRVAAEMSELADRGWVRHRHGMAPGWSLTPGGRRRGEELVRAEVASLGAQRQVDACYSSFLPMNSELLSICTDWQTMPVGGELVPNDHADRARDEAVLARLDALHRAATPLLAALAEAVARFEPYVGRLERAHRHVRAGRTEWIAKPTVDSYHGTWFELHEHLLVTLGRDRAGELSPEHVPTANGGSG